MKICPTCRRTYDDDGLNFCLEDGSLLTFTSVEAAPTIVMEHARPTSPTQNQGIRTSWDAQNAPVSNAAPKKKSSKAWVWVLAIFAVLILVCGGGFAGVFFYLASIASDNTVVANANKGVANTANKTNTVTRTNSNTAPPDNGTVNEVRLADWVSEPTTEIETEFKDGEFVMKSKLNNYYYVLVARESEFDGGNVARVSVRNADDRPVSLGFGLVFHSDITPLTNDYALLINTKTRKYRVVRHQNLKEKTVTAWTSSNLIKQGTEANLLAAHDNGAKIDLYINGQLATSITNSDGPKSGFPGLYVGDGGRIAFKKLEVVK